MRPLISEALLFLSFQSEQWRQLSMSWGQGLVRIAVTYSCSLMESRLLQVRELRCRAEKEMQQSWDWLGLMAVNKMLRRERTDRNCLLRDAFEQLKDNCSAPELSKLFNAHMGAAFLRSVY